MNKQSGGIIGGGLAVLTAAYFIIKENIGVSIIEARKRLGERIYTQYSNTQTPIVLGAT